MENILAENTVGIHQNNNIDRACVTNKIQKYLPTAYKFIDEHEEEWKLYDSNNDVDLEVNNHVLRVKIQDGSIINYLSEALALCRSQNKDGGWGNRKNDKESKIRATSFCVQMLVRANRVLKNKIIRETIISGLNYIVNNQLDDGSWKDPTWHYLDAISTSVGTLLFVVNEEFVIDSYRKALENGMRVITSERKKNGLWYYKPSGSPVTITAHLLQKCAVYYGNMDINNRTIRELIKLQHSDGHWDDGNTDHTCDAIRSMMITSSKSGSGDIDLINEVNLSSYKAISWLSQVSEEIGGGLGDRPGEIAHVERTCDGIDAMLKFLQFLSDNKQMIKFWN